MSEDIAGYRTIKIAVVQATNGQVTVCGPDEVTDSSGPMDAALCWALEAGKMPANRYWITVTLPSPSLTEIDLDAELEAMEPTP